VKVWQNKLIFDLYGALQVVMLLSYLL